MLNIRSILFLLFIFVWGLSGSGCFLFDCLDDCDNAKIEIGTIKISECSMERIPEVLTVERTGTNEITVKHDGAWYNCCLDTVEVEIDAKHGKITLYELEIAPNPCYCMCGFNIWIEIENLKKCKEYEISLYNSDGVLVGKTSIILD